MWFKLPAAYMSAAILMMSNTAMAQDTKQPFVRLAELEIAPGRLEQFQSEAREQIEAAVTTEPGVLALYAVSIKDSPALVRVFEMYVDEAAYRAHLETSHFKKFRDGTSDIVISRKLIDTLPIILAAKPR